MGVEPTLASPKGWQPAIGPKSDLPENQTPAMARFKKDAAAQEALANTVKLATMKPFRAKELLSTMRGALAYSHVAVARATERRALRRRHALLTLRERQVLALM